MNDNQLIKCHNLIVDANSLFMRAGFGFGQNDREEEANDAPASYVFLKSLRAIIQSTEAKRVFLCFDTKAKWRFERYPAYKGDRAKNKANAVYEGVMDQLNRFLEIAKLLNCYFIRVDGHEADDSVFVLSKVLKEQTTVLSTDLDLVQCCSSNVVWYDSKYQRVVRLEDGILQGREAYTGVPVEFKKQDPNGLTVDEFNLIKAISAGDDNIKGLPRIGWLTALRILRGEHKKELGEIYDTYYPRDKVDPSFELKSVEEIDNLTEEERAEYETNALIKGTTVIDRNTELMVLSKNPYLPELAREVQAQIRQKEFDIANFRSYLIETKMSSILIDINDFLRPFSLLS